ncbi:hypothetical protein D3C86_1295770 [compost metagenome]
MANGFPRVANRLAAGGTGAGGRDDASAQAKEQAGIHRRGVRHHLHVRGAGDVVGVLFGQHGGKFAHRAGTAGGRTVGNPGFTVGQYRFANQPGLLQRFFSGARRHQRHAAHRADTLAGVMLR